ncbi:magnesium transporter MgtE N-terminal domain-containing protein [Actinoallomurus soli]|uniref:magnesium transporter MgtE N-terminal domain-containing protein n=1 Tax=Actinoallomurus soli TaxID=2952535 RepID=UPI0020924664|nr:CBS domain-containing protein [Actinoallomurus soli]MCO5972781.1 CBS domain-containing protein [Actinoallomurus soli]
MGRQGLLAAVPRAVRQRYGQRNGRLTRRHSVRQALIPLAGLVGRPVVNQAGQQIGRLVDLVARWNGRETYPAVTGLVVQVGRRRSWVPYEVVNQVEPQAVTLRSARLDLREFEERPGEVALATHVLDHQLVDIEGVRVVRPSDLYLTPVEGRLRLVGMDTGLGALARRLGPARWRRRAVPEQVIDWSDVQAFGGPAGRGGARLAAPRAELRRLHPAELADLLEDLGRPERRELLDLVGPDHAADALEEMRPDQLEELLTEADPGQAAGLVARMEPDEAADALRDLDAERRALLLARLPEQTRSTVCDLLARQEDCAGGLMTTTIIRVRPEQTVAQVRDLLTAEGVHIADIDAVAVVDENDRLLDDVILGELLLADPGTTLGELVGPPWPITLRPEAGPAEVATRLAESRRLSVLVVDEEERPLGRILADDVVDMLLPERGRLHFPRVLS